MHSKCAIVLIFLWARFVLHFCFLIKDIPKVQLICMVASATCCFYKPFYTTNLKNGCVQVLRPNHIQAGLASIPSYLLPQAIAAPALTAASNANASMRVIILSWLIKFLMFKIFFK